MSTFSICLSNMKKLTEKGIHFAKDRQLHSMEVD